MIDYVLGFPDQATAIADPVVGAFYSTDGGWRGDVCIPGVAVTVLGTGTLQTDPVTGQTWMGPDTPFDALWRIVIGQTTRNPQLDASPSTQLVADRNAALAGAPMSTFILQNALPLTLLATLQISPTPLGARYPFGQ